MIVLKTIVKLLLFPAAVALTLVQWIGIFLNSISGVVMGILFFLSLRSDRDGQSLFGLAPRPKFLKMMIAEFVIFLIPHIGNWLVERIAVLRFLIGDFIRS